MDVFDVVVFLAVVALPFVTLWISGVLEDRE